MAISAVKNLPEQEQDAIASIILEELADERLWDDKFARSQDALRKLADRARQDVREGRVVERGIDEL